MPEFTTHHIFGEIVQKSMPSNIAETVNKQWQPFLWGLHGPDVLFYTKLIRDRGRVARAGAAMHHTDAEALFSDLLEYIVRHKNDARYELLCSYLYGFICHYALDEKTHPFVYYQINNLESLPQTVRHAMVESEIGSLLYRRFTGNPVSSFNIYDYYTLDSAFLTPISEMYVYLIGRVMNQAVSVNEVIYNFPFCLRVNAFTYLLAGGADSSRMVKGAEAIVRKFSLLSSFMKNDHVDHDALNLLHKKWNNVNFPENVQSDSFLDLFDLAKAESLSMIYHCHRMLANGKVEPLGLTASFDNGEPANKKEKYLISKLRA